MRKRKTRRRTGSQRGRKVRWNLHRRPRSVTGKHRPLVLLSVAVHICGRHPCLPRHGLIFDRRSIQGDKGGVEAISIQTLAHTHLNICTSEMQNVNRPLPPSPPSSQHLRWPGVLLKRTLTFIVIIYLFSLFPWFKRLAFWDSLSVAAWAEYRSINK